MLDKVITKELISKWEKSKRGSSLLEEEIVKRVDYIIETIYKTLGVEYISWWFSSAAAEGEVGEFVYDDFNICYEICFGGRPKTDDLVIVLKDGSEWSFENDFLTRWLFEDFEQELIDGRNKYQDRRKNQEEENKFFLKNIKSKLSKEELKFFKNNYARIVKK